MTRKLLVLISILLLIVFNLSVQFTLEQDERFNLKSLKMTMNAFAEDDPPFDPDDPFNPFPKPNSPFPPYDTFYVY